MHWPRTEKRQTDKERITDVIQVARRSASAAAAAAATAAPHVISTGGHHQSARLFLAATESINSAARGDRQTSGQTGRHTRTHTRRTCTCIGASDVSATVLCIDIVNCRHFSLRCATLDITSALENAWQSLACSAPGLAVNSLYVWIS